MKKGLVICVLSAVIAVLLSLTVCAETCDKRGDLNGDGNVDILDLLLIQNTILGKEPSVEHFEKTIPAVMPTCTETGLTEGKYCAICDEVTVAQTVVNAKGHTEVIDEAVAPSETKTGLTEGKHCSVYGHVIVAQETIPALGAMGLAYEINNDNRSCTVTGIGSFNGTELIIPDKICGYTVTAIGEKAFAECAALTEIKLPDSVTSIGTRAFYGCTGLTEFIIPKNVSQFGTQLFYKATNLKTVYYHSSYSSGQNNLILNTTSINKVVFGGVAVPNSVCYKCVNIKTVEICDSVTTINYCAFYGCSGLTNITIPDSVTSIGNSAFYNCYNLNRVYYKGTSEEWNLITIDINNDPLLNATRYYYSATEPTEAGNYWRYVDGEPVILIW